MHILLLAPHPFFQERGTPIAVDLLLRVLSERGDQVDVLTYHEGEERAYPGATLHRIPSPPGVHNVPPGLSIKKLVCDAFLLTRAERLARAGNYDLVHAVEESVFMAMRLKRRHCIPYVYDMDSSMPRQIREKHAACRFLLPIMQACERRAIRGAVAVVAVCDALADIAREGGAAYVTLLRDVSLLSIPGAIECPAELACPVDGTTFTYIGNLEGYQGIDLLLESFSRAVTNGIDGQVVVVGGTPRHIEAYRRKLPALKLVDRVHFVGPRPTGALRAIFSQTDVLVSPRIKGNNTPMKIYSYLDSGKAILATQLPTHTQVLDDTTACLVSTDPRSFSQAMLQLAADPSLRERLGRQARERAQAQYSFDVYRNTLLSLYGQLEKDIHGSSP